MTSVNQIPIDCQKTFIRYVRFLEYIGLKIFDESPNGLSRGFLILVLYNIITSLPFIVVQMCLLLNINEDNFLDRSHIVPLGVVFLLGGIKINIATAKQIQLRDTLIEIGNLWPRDLEDNHKKAVVYKNWLRWKGMLFNFHFINVTTTLTLFEVVPLLVNCYNIYNGVNEYIFAYQLPEWWKCDTVFIYFLTYIWQVICTGPMIFFIYLPLDLLLMIITSNVSLLFRLLQIDLENAIEVSDDAEVKAQLHILDDGSYQRIKTVIMIHQRLLRLADNVSDIFGMVLFVHITSSSIMICFYGFLTVAYGEMAEAIPNILCVLGCLTTVFLLSFVGQLLSDTSSDIGEAAYRSAWYDSDNKVRNLIKLIMIRAHRPSYLSALGFSELTLRSFTKIISSAWTYFTLLLQLYSEK